VTFPQIGPCLSCASCGPNAPWPFAFTYSPYTKEKVGYSRQKCEREQNESLDLLWLQNVSLRGEGEAIKR